MLSTLKTYLANQARQPSGWFGRIVAPRIFDKTNGPMEQFGLKVMNLNKDDRILEIGFGQGRMISKMASRLNDGKVCGIDISDEMVEVAGKRNDHWIQNNKVELRKASIAEIPYPDNHFDKVFTCNTIYFWPNPEKNIKEVKRVLKPEGTFFCAFRDKDLMKSKSSAVTENREVFENLYDPEEVKKLYKAANFRKIDHHQKDDDSETIHLITGMEGG